MTTSRSTRATLSRRTIAAVLVVAALSATLFAAPRFFTARFQKKLSSHVQDADSAYVVNDGVVYVRQGAPNKRHYIATKQSDYLSSDWTYEVTFNKPNHAPPDILFIGFGEGVPDPSFWTEPRNSVNFRIHQGSPDASGGQVDLAAHDEGSFSFTYFQGAVGYLSSVAGGTYIARIRKVGPRVTFEILGTDIVATIEDVNVAAPFLKNGPTAIFFGNALGAYTWTDMRVLPERTKKHK